MMGLMSIRAARGREQEQHESEASEGPQQIQQGHLYRGIETMMPTFAKNAMKSYRYAAEGVNSLRGDPIVADVAPGESLVQALGFRPTRVADQQRINAALKGYESAIQRQRETLMNALALSIHTQDADARSRVLGKIQAFNRAFPEIAITPTGVRQSLQRRAR